MSNNSNNSSKKYYVFKGNKKNPTWVVYIKVRLKNCHRMHGLKDIVLRLMSDLFMLHEIRSKSIKVTSFKLLTNHF